MWPFRRRRGRHELGAVRAVPPVPAMPAVPPVPPVLPPPIPAQQPSTAAAAVPSYEEAVPAGPRVELGFRDGSTAALAPGSAQAKALTDIASALTQRD